MGGVERESDDQTSSIATFERFEVPLDAPGGCPLKSDAGNGSH
jgi:hypothetical protein